MRLSDISNIAILLIELAKYIDFDSKWFTSLQLGNRGKKSSD